MREITEKNFDDCIKLKVAEDQKSFVDSNVESIAESKVRPYFIPLAVYNDEELVGFTMHGKHPERKNYYIMRLMIDEKFQDRGFGTQATLKLIELMGKNKDCDAVYLFFVPENTVVEILYSKLGFKRTGVIAKDGEIEMRLGLSK